MQFSYSPVTSPFPETQVLVRIGLPVKFARIGPGLMRSQSIFLQKLARPAAASVIAASLFLSSCTSTSTALDAGTASFADSSLTGAEDAVTDESGVSLSALLPESGFIPKKRPARAASEAPQQTAMLASDRPPLLKPADASDVAQQAIASASSASEVPVQTAAAAADDSALATGTVASAKPAAAASQESATIAAIAPEVPKKTKSLFGTLFASAPQKPAANVAEAAPAFEVAAIEPKKAEPEVQLANLDKPLTRAKREVISDAPDADNGALPGVRQSALFEIKHRNSASDDTNVDISEEDSGPIQVAYAAGLARLAPNGLKVQRESVDVACLKPQLVKVLKGVERHYGREVVVTSGFRSPTFNRRVRGAKHSLHMYCAAADIQVSGVSKWALAQYLRSLPGRGGVGTYCHTDSIHVDIGPDRDWNWRCSRGQRRR
jgi:uncharacterized protein YcbK (DUF882 family)